MKTGFISNSYAVVTSDLVRFAAYFLKNRFKLIPKPFNYSVSLEFGKFYILHVVLLRSSWLKGKEDVLILDFMFSRGEIYKSANNICVIHKARVGWFLQTFCIFALDCEDPLGSKLRPRSCTSVFGKTFMFSMNKCERQHMLADAVLSGIQLLCVINQLVNSLFSLSPLGTHRHKTAVSRPSLPSRLLLRPEG